jgi:hypothetical protein
MCKKIVLELQDFPARLLEAGKMICASKEH